MYIKRSPLGQGNLTFKKRRARYPVLLILLYLAILAGALLALANVDKLQPQISQFIGPPSTATPQPDVVARQAEEAYHAGDLAKASDIYKQASQIAPQDVGILTAYGRVLTLNHQLTDALAVADRIIAVAPQDPRGYAIKARALDWGGQYQDSVIAALNAIQPMLTWPRPTPT
jgi:tetratricopeptide (TPR) repeat protein